MWKKYFSLQVNLSGELLSAFQLQLLNHSSIAAHKRKECYFSEPFHKVRHAGGMYTSFVLEKLWIMLFPKTGSSKEFKVFYPEIVLWSCQKRFAVSLLNQSTWYVERLWKTSCLELTKKVVEENLCGECRYRPRYLSHAKRALYHLS